MILIVGCGFLGARLIPALRAVTDESILITTRSETSPFSAPNVTHTRCDVTNRADLISLAERCKGEALTVFYFAACHNIDYIVEHPQEAARINLDGLRLFLQSIPQIDRLFFASTDCVYGENTSLFPVFPETAPLIPVNVYGAQKKAAETIVWEAGFTCIRFGYMLGASCTGKKHFYDKLLNDLRNGKTVEMIDGMTRSVLSYTQAAQLLAKLLSITKQSLPDALNLCGDEGLTKYEMGLRIAQSKCFPAGLIRPISESEGKKFFKDRRASNAVMDNSRLKELLGVGRIVWDPTQ